MKLLEVPYFSQRDNRFHPGGSCNVTSIGMCLWYWGIRGDGSYPQLEDQLYQRCEQRGWDRHDPYDLKALVESFPGLHDTYTDKGGLCDIRGAIDAGQPCVVHSFSTGAGHIWVIRGYDEGGFWVNDPNGEWSPWNYANKSGERLHYSTRMVGATCGSWTYEQAQELYSSSSFNPESPRNIYLHRIGKV